MPVRAHNGGYAEFCLRLKRDLPVPKDCLVEAALPETVFTVWHNVFERAA
jgi:hypothetical protein